MKAPRSLRTGCALALVVSVFGGNRACADQLVGVVKSVDTQGQKFVVIEQTTDRALDIGVTPNTAITSSGGRPLTLKGLRKGDGVGIAHVDGIATAVTVNQAPLLGVVESVDLDGKVLLVDEKETHRDIKVALLPETTIETAGGKIYAFKDLKSGDGISVIYDGENVAKVLVNVKPDELTGHVKSVAADLKSFVVTEIDTKADVKVAVTPDTVIVTGEGKTMALKDLKKGDGVGIAHRASVASKVVVNAAPAPER